MKRSRQGDSVQKKAEGRKKKKKSAADAVCFKLLLFSSSPLQANPAAAGPCARSCSSWRLLWPWCRLVTTS
jgi:hypothetical protein